MYQPQELDSTSHISPSPETGLQQAGRAGTALPRGAQPLCPASLHSEQTLSPPSCFHLFLKLAQAAAQAAVHWWPVLWEPSFHCSEDSQQFPYTADNKSVPCSIKQTGFKWAVERVLHSTVSAGTDLVKGSFVQATSGFRCSGLHTLCLGGDLKGS